LETKFQELESVVKLEGLSDGELFVFNTASYFEPFTVIDCGKSRWLLNLTTMKTTMWDTFKDRDVRRVVTDPLTYRLK